MRKRQIIAPKPRGIFDAPVIEIVTGSDEGDIWFSCVGGTVVAGEVTIEELQIDADEGQTYEPVLTLDACHANAGGRCMTSDFCRNPLIPIFEEADYFRVVGAGNDLTLYECESGSSVGQVVEGVD